MAAKTKAKAKPKAKAKSTAKAKPKAKIKAAPKAKAKRAARPAVKAAAKRKARPVAKAKPAPKLKAKPAAKPKTKIAAKPKSIAAKSKKPSRPAKPKPVPDHRRSATPYLAVRDCAAALEFYRRAFNARELMRMPHGGKIGHAEFQFGDAAIMISDEYPDLDVLSPHALGGSPVTIHLYVADVDKTFEQAIAAGARVLRPLTDEFYGDRVGKLVDPYGHLWFLATNKETVTFDEMMKRAAAKFPGDSTEAPKEAGPAGTGGTTPPD